MSLVQSFKYKCIQCKEIFRYNNQCRCKNCGKIDADTCISCHNNNHIKETIVTVLGLSSGFIAYMAFMVGYA